ncbi:hypothetical protein CTI18_07090 [Prevotella intermedia]|uniref:Uncharacterized protein n=2 Tax=Prevotella intermedia TaxID=28131 RepID=A0A2G8IDL8_PREIN|nr:hypothetical protein CTI18_07090 [Prevotella intermedia]
MAIATTAFSQSKAVYVGKQSPKKAAQKTVYYLKPAGALFEATPKTGKMVGTSYLYVPGYGTAKFAPVAPKNAQFFWHQNIYDMNGNCTSFDRTGQTGKSFSIDNEGNFYLTSRFNGADALPTIVCGTDSFTLSEENPHWGPLDYDLPAVMYWYPRIKSGTLTGTETHIRPLQFTDDKVNGYFLGGMDNGYLFGSGTISGGQYTSRGVQQVLEKPMAPLWVEDIFLTAISKSSTPLPKSTELTMLITNVETDAQGVKKPGSEILAELKCTADNLEANDPINDNNGKTYNKFAAVFYPEGKGFLIDKEFAVIVRGFDQAGVDMGLSGVGIPYYNKVLNPALCLITTKDGNKKTANIYADNNIALGVTFSAKFDYANGYVDEGSATSFNYGLVQMNNEGTMGQTTCTQGMVFPGAVAQLNGAWYDEKKQEQYTLSGMASWIKGYTIDEESYKDYGLTVVKFTCEALPSNVQGRKCDILIHGKGVVSNKPLTVVQGDITAGIDNINKPILEKEYPMYNAAGQRVQKGYKGIVIQNGMKRVNK